VEEDAVALLFDKFLKDKNIPQREYYEPFRIPDEYEPLQNHLFFYCVGKAADLQLPVKLHTGYFSGNANMSLERMRKNAGDLYTLLGRFPGVKFVLMHIGYPYQDEFIALAKHYPNVYLDMCWAWIINPVASIRFLKEFLVTAPASKIFTFGGDYAMVETVYGHSRIARQGIAQAISELVEEKWLSVKDALDIIPRIMHDNAYEAFRIAEKTKIWNLRKRDCFAGARNDKRGDPQ
jgi:predicted TIM-barrel fold metal-dependent hydrolase